MKLELFNDGTAIFSDCKPSSNLKIEAECNGYLHIGDKAYPIKDGIASVSTLPQGDYRVKVTTKANIYRAYEHIVVSDNGMASVDSSHLRNMVIPLKKGVDKLKDDVAELKKQIKEHERKISGYSLFGN